MAITAAETLPLESMEPRQDEAPEKKEPVADVSESAPLEGPDRATIVKLISAGYAFFVAGVNDGSLGALIPHIIRDYHVETSVVSSVYGANFFGWFLAAVSNFHLCQYLDLGSMLAIGAGLQILSQVLRIWRPPFILFTVTFWITSLGQAYQDTHANTFVAAAKRAHRWLGFIHAMYMAGCLMGPFVATSVASANSPSRWNLFYSVPLGLGIINLALVLVAFRDQIGLLGKATTNSPADGAALSSGPAEQSSRNRKAFSLIKDTLQSRSVWLLSLFFFFYLGGSITAGAWVVEYLVVVRNGGLSQMGYVPAGFSGGCLLGRLILVEPTFRWGERRIVFICSLLCVGLQLIFWLVPNIIAASAAISLLGFFSGPFFATGISIGSKLFAPEARSNALAFVFVVAQIGGSLFPIMTGVIAARASVAVLQPMLVGLFSATTITWLLVPRPKSTDNAALHQE